MSLQSYLSYVGITVAGLIRYTIMVVRAELLNANFSLIFFTFFRVIHKVHSMYIIRTT